MTFLNCSRNFETHQFEGWWCDQEENRGCSMMFESEQLCQNLSHFFNDLRSDLSSDLFEFMMERMS